MDKPKILFVTPSFQSFIKNDIEILSKKYTVIINHYNWQNKNLAPLFFTLQALVILWQVLRVKTILISFGGYWAFWPSIYGKLLGKKVYIILHGTDCASIPELKYGSLRISLLKWICGKSYRNATALLPVSESLAETELDFNPIIIHKKQGFLFHFPNLRTPFEIIYNGLDEAFWSYSSFEEKVPNSFLAVLSASQFELKGGDLIVEVASEFPDFKFYFAGITEFPNPKRIPDNVVFLGKLEPDELRKQYRRTMFYFQLSSYEGFGCALSEAMLCGCIPIGSKVNHIPQIIGKSGLILEKKNKELLKTTIQNAVELQDKPEIAIAARKHIINNYTLEQREKKLLGYIKN